MGRSESDFVSRSWALAWEWPQRSEVMTRRDSSRNYPIEHCPDSRHLDGLSKQLDWEVRKVQRWFRHRRNQDKPSTLTKFCESMWRFTFYLCIFIYGLRFLWQSPWMWDTRHCWYNYPYQVLSPGLYYFYVTELAFYWSLVFSQFTDIKRKDFLIMFIHHLATVGLISFSYVNNMVRVGTLVMFVHDSSDFLLEAAKLANYARYQRLCDSVFVVFSGIFFGTRLIIFPFWILHTTLFESWEIVGPYPSWWLFNGLLLVLQVLHIIWSCLIARIAYKAIVRGKKRLCSSFQIARGSCLSLSVLLHPHVSLAQFLSVSRGTSLFCSSLLYPKTTAATSRAARRRRLSR
ncbi:ceramide synthase 5 isoform X3 [Conger conger]|uniref:ceramide synthase 5 isoform X3 n=1 Tax=Conger conger TaxID=82655 RepID=UPI002A599281|nr:ceramide synthase 5 isoform X3 [Conger conger]